ncbi:class I SAM-dependent methyltransferase [Nonomuraea sp. NPDC050310]|uniref:O-methyltransferase n=1 Tax=Nonomuraea sp. NPDC050310 TaxID=3154935 RepID=UPI0033D2018A
MTALPGLVRAALAAADAAAFPHSCDPGTGRLLATLAAGVRAGGRVIEIGTGTGAGAAWLVSGLLPRTDVTVTTIENDPERAAAAARLPWPDFVDLQQGDALELLQAVRGRCDLLFADAAAGKQHGLDLSVAALAPGGTLIVDDMTEYPGSTWPEDFRARQRAVRERLLGDPGLVAAELPHGPGLILATRRR